MVVVVVVVATAATGNLWQTISHFTSNNPKSQLNKQNASELGNNNNSAAAVT